MAEELVKGIKSTSKSGSPHNDSNAALVKRWFAGMAAAAALILKKRRVFRNSQRAMKPGGPISAAFLVTYRQPNG
jgi:hypothetical protein